jgi:CRP-like cAMP-binding protein
VPRSELWRQAIGRLAAFRDLDDREIDRVASLTTTIRVRAGRVLTRVGEVGQEFFVIVDGIVGVEQGPPDAARPVALLGPGDFFGEISLLERVPRTASVTALTPTTVMVSSVGEFRSLLGIEAVGTKLMAAAFDRELANLLAG